MNETLSCFWCGGNHESQGCPNKTKCRCGSGLIAGLNGRCWRCNRAAGELGARRRKDRLWRESNDRLRSIQKEQHGVEARLRAARARLAHDPNVDPVDPAAGDVVVDCHVVPDAWSIITGGHQPVYGTISIGTMSRSLALPMGLNAGWGYAPNHLETSAPSAAGMGGGRLC